MKKLITILFLSLALGLWANTDENATSTNTDTTISREVIGTNQQQLDIKEIDTEELLLQNQNLESTSIEISGENFKKGEDRIKIQQTTTVSLEEELSLGVEKKSFFGWIASLFN